MSRRTDLTAAAVTALIAIGLCHARPAAATGERALAGGILDASGVKGGLCVHLGCGDGKLTAELGTGGGRLVQGLSDDPAKVAAARKYLQGRGLYGSVSIIRASYSPLPYADNLANLIVADDLPGLLKRGGSIEEMLRVVCPAGTLLLGGPSEAELKKHLATAGVMDFQPVKIGGGAWARIVKPRPAEMDDWTHRGYGPANTAVSHDTALEPVSSLRWIMGPSYNAICPIHAVVVAGGRIFYVTKDTPDLGQQDPLIERALIARDAFSGVRLWTRTLPTGYKPIDPAKLKGLDKRKRQLTIQYHRRASTPPFWNTLVAAGDRVYSVIGGDVVALDAATGRTVKTYEKGTSPARILVHKGDLILAGAKSLRAVDIASGKLRWEKASAAKNLVIGDGRIFALGGGTRARELICRDRYTGQEKWRTKVRPPGGWQSYFFYGKGVLAFVGGKRSGGLVAISAEDGKVLWNTRGFNRYDAYFVDGLIWVRRTEPVTPAPSPKRGPALPPGDKGILPPPKGPKAMYMVAMDPRTGKRVKRVLVRKSYGGGCYRRVATTRYAISTRGLIFISWTKGTVGADFRGGRHACSVGVIPANGLLYNMPQGCQCVKDAVRGFLAFSAAPKLPPAAHPLEKGPAYGANPLVTAKAVAVAGQSTIRNPQSDWPTFRADPQRSASTKAPVPAGLKLLWETKLDDPKGWARLLRNDWRANPSGGDPVTGPTVSGDAVFVSLGEANRVVALDAKTGRPRWSFTAGGRLDAPPTIHQGLCLFGSADGWVYCLRADDGQLVWRFRAAPCDQRIVAFGQVESRWPVVGGVLVEGGVAYCVAGRSAAVDGGLYVHALDPRTGKLHFSKGPTGGGLCDLLVSTGRKVVMANGDVGGMVSFDLVKKPQSPPGQPAYLKGGASSKGGTLSRSWRTSRVLDRSWHHFAQSPPPDEASRAKPPVSPEKYRRLKWFWRYGLLQSFRGCQGQLVVGEPDRDRAFAYRSIAPLRWGEVVAREAGKTSWFLDVPQPRRVDAMVLAGEVLFLAGPADRQHRHAEGFLWAVSAKDGEKLTEIKLEAAPSSEGMAAAGGRLYVAARDGRLLCFGKE